MKVLYLANALPHYFNAMLNTLNSYPGVEVVVICPADTSHQSAIGVFESHEDINFRCLFLPECSRRLYISFRGLIAVLWRERPDVVMLPDYALRAFVFHPVLALSRWLLDIKLVLKSIPFELPDLAASRAEIAGLRRQAAAAGGLNAVGAYMKVMHRWLAMKMRQFRYRSVEGHVVYIDEGRDFYASYGAAPERVFVVRNSPDTDAFQAVASTIRQGANPPVRASRGIIFVGRLVPQKRGDLLLRAFKKVHERFPDATLTLVGAGPQKNELLDLVTPLGLEGAVTFAGGVYEPEQLGRQFLAHSLFVLPGLGGMAINEAMSFHLPVICARGDGTERFLVRENVNGRFFKDGDQDDLSRVIIEILEDPDRLRSMGEKSHDIIQNEVNLRTVAANYKTAFDFVLAH